MSNPSFANGLIKIGQTKQDPEERRKELSSSTSSPKPFVIEYQALVEDYEKAERKVHNYLDEFRDNKNREYFNCGIAAAIVAIRDYATVIHEDVYGTTPEEIKRIETKKASEVAERERLEVISKDIWNIKESTRKAKKREKLQKVKHERIQALLPLIILILGGILVFWLRRMGYQTGSDWYYAFGILIGLPLVVGLLFHDKLESKFKSDYEFSFTPEEMLWIQYTPHLTDEEIYEVHNLTSFQDKKDLCVLLKRANDHFTPERKAEIDQLSQEEKAKYISTYFARYDAIK